MCSTAGGEDALGGKKTYARTYCCVCTHNRALQVDASSFKTLKNWSRDYTMETVLMALKVGRVFDDLGRMPVVVSVTRPLSCLHPRQFPPLAQAEMNTSANKQLSQPSDGTTFF